MSFNQEIIEQLGKPLDQSRVKSRDGLDYIEGWDAIDHANKIFGYGCWSYSVDRLECVVDDKHFSRDNREGYIVGYLAVVTVRVHESANSYQDTGTGEGISYSSRVKSHESASKEAVTDALKRALKNYGYTFGLALYDKKKTNVIDEASKQLASDVVNTSRKLYGDGYKDYIDKIIAELSLRHGKDFHSVEDLPAVSLNNWITKLKEKEHAEPKQGDADRQSNETA